MNTLRPYWAVIVDSFRESLNSKVLWCLLGLITFFLLAVAPVGVAFTNATHLHRSEIDEIAKFATQLEQGGSEPTANPRGQVWAKFNDKLKTDLSALANEESPDRRSRFDAKNRLVKALNKQIDENELFSESQLASLTLNKEGQDLAAKSVDPSGNGLTTPERRRLNRLALAACYPRFFRGGAKEAMQVTYLGIRASDPLPFDRNNLDTGIKYGLVVFMSVFAAPLGVFTAILVTASIIPNMFDAGSVNLLFSKPINRALLYLTKFFGGCWFVFINASYLIVGVWFVLGLRIGIWHEKLLWVIPVLTFLFAVYYSVSAFAGIVWRNTIMCITAAVLFWAVCFAVGFLHELLDGLLVQPQRISRIVNTSDSLLVVKENGEVARWNDDRSDWEPVFAPLSPQMGPSFAHRNRLIGPVFDSDNNRILAIKRDFSNSRLVAGSPDDNYQRERLDTAPARSIALLAEPNSESDPDSKTSFIIVEREGISRLVAKQGPENKTLNVFGAKYTLGPKRGSFRAVGPKSYEHARDATQAVINPTDGALFVFAPGAIHRLEASGSERKYAVTQERALASKEASEDESDDPKDALLAANGEYLTRFHVSQLGRQTVVISASFFITGRRGVTTRKPKPS